ncbi:MAG: winged helix-turn-helix transcriptional regulator [Thermoplasmatota archaeon]
MTEALELDVRRRLYEVVHQYPGLHLREVSRRARLETNHAKYHLRYLERHELVASTREDGYWRFWPTGKEAAPSRQERRWLGLLRRPVPFGVALTLAAEGERSAGALAEAVGVTPGTLTHHLKRLEKAGVVATRPDGRRKMVRLCDADAVIGLLGRHRPPKSLVNEFLDTWDALDLRAGADAEDEEEGEERDGGEEEVEEPQALP